MYTTELQLLSQSLCVCACVLSLIRENGERERDKDKNCPLPDSAYHCAMLITANTDEAKDVFQVCQQKAPNVMLFCTNVWLIAKYYIQN